MRELFRQLQQAINNDEDAVLVTVVASSGSTPRGAGARMLVTKRGRLRGTIGGGAVEYRSEQTAQKILGEKRSLTQCFRLHRNEVEDLGMICGGDVTVYFQYIPAGDRGTLALTRQIELLFESGEQSWLISEIAESGKGGLSVYGRKSGLIGPEVPVEVLGALRTGSFRCEVNGRAFYCESLVRSGRVYIFGGGHVAQALVPVLAAVDFRCIVLEDREDFSRPELFHGVEETRLIDNTRVADYADIGADDYIIIMTRGHKDDRLILAQAFKTPAHYIGVIGSAKKTAGVNAALRKEGFTSEDFARVTTPIGLSIRAETPAEIAVSIAAQLIQVRAERTAVR